MPETTFNSDISQAPKNCGLLLQYSGFPYPLTGVLRDDFEGGIVLVLPSFEVKPDPDYGNENDWEEFAADPDQWLRDIAEHNLINEFINIEPSEYSLIKPPKSWKLQGWLKAWDDEEIR